MTLVPEVEALPLVGRRVRWRSMTGVCLMTLARLALGLGMFTYGLSKVVALQFQLPAWTYAQPLGAASGKTLTWAMMGYSPHFQMALGWFELVPALLLLSARTRRLGALLMFPVLANVVLINYALDLWPATQHISLAMLALNVFLILYDLPVYLNFLRGLLAAPTPIANPRLRLAARIAGAVVPMALLVTMGVSFFREVHAITDPVADFTGERQINRAGTWAVRTVELGGRAIPVPPETRAYFDFGGRCVIGALPRPSIGSFKSNQTKHTFEITKVTFAGSASDYRGTYQLAGDQMRLQGERDGQSLAMTLARDHWGHMH